MSNVFSTRQQGTFFCAAPELTVGFPHAQTSGNTVVLANGAVVDLNVLAKILLQNCPGLHQPLQPTTATVPVVDMMVPATVSAMGTVTATPMGTTTVSADVNTILNAGMMNTAMMNTAVTNTAMMNGMLANMASQTNFLNAMDLRDGPGLDQMALASMMANMAGTM